MVCKNHTHSITLVNPISAKFACSHHLTVVDSMIPPSMPPLGVSADGADGVPILADALIHTCHSRPWRGLV